MILKGSSVSVRVKRDVIYISALPGASINIINKPYIEDNIEDIINALAIHKHKGYIYNAHACIRARSLGLGSDA